MDSLNQEYVKKHEYDKNRLLQNLCYVEVNGLIDGLHAFLVDSQKVLNVVHEADCGHIFKQYDLYNTMILDVMNMARKFSAHLREFDINVILGAGINKTKSYDKMLKASSLCLTRPHLAALLPDYVTPLPLGNICTGSMLMAWITYIEIDCEQLSFYVCQKSPQEMVRICDVLAPISASSFPKQSMFGMMLTDKPDKVLHRVVCSSLQNSNSTELLLIDQGELLPHVPSNAEFYELQSSCHELPAQAIHCKLVGLSTAQESFETESRSEVNGLENVLLQHRHQLCLFYVVDNNGRTLKLHFLKAQAEVKETASALPPAQHSATKDIDLEPTIMQSLAIDATIELTPTFVESPSVIYGHIKSPEQSEFSWSNDELAAQSKGRVGALTDVQPGELVLAQRPCDTRWYRAKVLRFKAQQAMYKVFFVDFGNQESLPLSCLAACHLPEHLARFRALRCHIAGLTEFFKIDCINESDRIKALRECIFDETLVAKVTERIEDALVLQLVLCEPNQ